MALGVFCHLNHHRILLCAKLGSGGIERVRARLKVTLKLTSLVLLRAFIPSELCCLFFAEGNSVI